MSLGAILGVAGKIGQGVLSKVMGDDQAKLQKQFAQNAIQWKVDDAKKAGVHPLYALGANTTSYSPVSVGMPDLGAMGQDIGGAIDRASSQPDKVSGQLAVLALRRAGLENDLLEAQIARARLNVAGSAPGPELAPRTDEPLIPGWVTARPNLGQAAENAYSEVGGNTFGTFGMVSDYFRNLARMYNDPRTVELLKRAWSNHGSNSVHDSYRNQSP